MKTKPTKLPLLKRARAYTLKPGDIVVLETPRRVSQEEAERLQASGILAFAPATVVVLEGGMTVRVLRYPPLEPKP